MKQAGDIIKNWLSVCLIVHYALLGWCETILNISFPNTFKDNAALAAAVGLTFWFVAEVQAILTYLGKKYRIVTSEKLEKLYEEADKHKIEAEKQS